MDAKKPARRTRRNSAERTALEQLLAARDRVDEEMVTRRRQEETALEMLAAAVVQAEQIDADRTQQLAELDRQREAVAQQHAERIAAVDTRRGEALLLLTEQGRSAEQLTEMTGIPTKRVRVMIRAAKAARQQTEAAGSSVTPGVTRAAADAAGGVTGDETAPVTQSTSPEPVPSA